MSVTHQLTFDQQYPAKKTLRGLSRSIGQGTKPLTFMVEKLWMFQAVTLGCSHSFCEFCINSWKSKPYSNNQCPICRSVICTEVRSLVLDQYISRILETLDLDLVHVRSDIIFQRKRSLTFPGCVGGWEAFIVVCCFRVGRDAGDEGQNRQGEWCWCGVS